MFFYNLNIINKQIKSHLQVDINVVHLYVEMIKNIDGSEVININVHDAIRLRKLQNQLHNSPTLAFTESSPMDSTHTDQ